MSKNANQDVRVLEKKRSDILHDVNSLSLIKKEQLSTLYKQISDANEELEKINNSIIDARKKLIAVNKTIKRKIEITEKYVKEITDNSIKMANTRIKVADKIRESSFFPLGKVEN